ncbi:MAG: protease [Verrucomicrobia bacterium]|nr:MAG: protease [Verrucomicrobiota bacterium]
MKLGWVRTIAWYGILGWGLVCGGWPGSAAEKGVSPAGDETGLLRFPTIHRDRVVFTHAGDLYVVPVEGGVARRLTSHPGQEIFARFSPDGRWLAFTGQYDGNTEVYVMPAEGGEPRRLTVTATLGRDDVSDRMGPNNIVMAWRDERTIVFRCRWREWNSFKGQLWTVDLEGGLPGRLPLAAAGWCSFSPDGQRMAFNRVFREFRTWKRYRGGQADDLWVLDFATEKVERLVENPAQDVFPMWHGNRVYFLSDRGEYQRMNVWVKELDTGTERQVTRFREFDVKFPSLGPEAIVFENGGRLYRLDLANEEVKRIPVRIQEDFPVARPAWRAVGEWLTDWSLGPDGARAVLTARGDVFTAPAREGSIRNLTQTPGVHERDAVWSPDGRWVAYISDASGEDEIHLRPADGSGEDRQLTKGGDTYKYGPKWSPDSRQLAWTDKKNRLWCVAVETGEMRLVDRSEAWEIHDFAWSPDSRWLAYVRPEPRRFADLFLFCLDDGRKVRVTEGWFEVSDPAFSRDGKYLLFVSRRNFHPTYSQTEWNHAYRDMERVYLALLAADTPSPLAPRSDEVKVKETPPEEQPDVEAAPDSKDRAQAEPAPTPEPSGADKTKGEAKKESAKEPTVRVDAEGLADRVIAIPGPASEYADPQCLDGKVYYRRKGELAVYDLDKRKETVLGEFDGYEISADGKKMLLRKGKRLAIVDLPSGKVDPSDHWLKLDGLRTWIKPGEEWRQIYHECWRQMRDFVYDPGLHGVDWPGLGERYGRLLRWVHHRADLTYVIGELIGELNLGHCYVGGGDMPKADRVQTGLLGARFERDPSGFFRIVEILPGRNWDESLRSPLREPGVGAKEGDYLVAIEGRRTDELKTPYEALIGRAGELVRLRLNDRPTLEGAREVLVRPIANEQPLYYLRWVLRNLHRVEQATDGRVGYVHIPDMGVNGLNQFARLYYPQLHKEALIVDVRGNGGGNVSPMIIERLRREPVFWTIARNGAVDIDPSGTFLGPKVMLIDQYSASDGDIVAYRFRHHRLGPLIGTRTWGGVVGMRGSLPLMDGGYLMKPEFSRFDLGAKVWIMEGHGVAPDIEVPNDPVREFHGIDDQLERAIQETLKALEKEAPKVPEPPPYPIKASRGTIAPPPGDDDR